MERKKSVAITMQCMADLFLQKKNDNIRRCFNKKFFGKILRKHCLWIYFVVFEFRLTRFRFFHDPVALLNRIRQTPSIVSDFWMVYFQRILFRWWLSVLYVENYCCFYVNGFFFSDEGSHCLSGRDVTFTSISHTQTHS